VRWHSIGTDVLDWRVSGEPGQSGAAVRLRTEPCDTWCVARPRLPVITDPTVRSHACHGKHQRGHPDSARRQRAQPLLSLGCPGNSQGIHRAATLARNVICSDAREFSDTTLPTSLNALLKARLPVGQISRLTINVSYWR